MAKLNDVYPSDFIKATKGGFIDMPELPEECEAVILTISGKLKTKEFDDGKSQRIASFRETEMTLGLNKTNWNKIAELTGEEDDDDWDGYEIELCVIPEEKSKTGHAIRIRKPRANTFRIKGPKKSKAGKGETGGGGDNTLGIEMATRIAVACELRGMTVRQLAIRIGETDKADKALAKLVDTPLAAWPSSVGQVHVAPLMKSMPITGVVDTDRKAKIEQEIKDELAKSVSDLPTFDDDIPF